MGREGESQDPFENIFPYFSLSEENFCWSKIYGTFNLCSYAFVSYFHVDWPVPKTQNFDPTPAQLLPLSKHQMDLGTYELLEFSGISLSKQKSKIIYFTKLDQNARKSLGKFIKMHW